MKRLTSSWYERLVRPLLFQMEPETAHHFALGLLRAAPRIPGALAFLRSFAPPPQPRTLFGLQFRNSVGLAAGFDKNGVAIPPGRRSDSVSWKSAPSPPNRSREIRDRASFATPEQEALINRLGFNNDGADVIAERLQRLRESASALVDSDWRQSRKSKVTPLEEAATDYLYSFRRLAPVADYIVLNVSSPNTQGLRTLQEHDALVGLFAHHHECECGVGLTETLAPQDCTRSLGGSARRNRWRPAKNSVSPA